MKNNFDSYLGAEFITDNKIDFLLDPRFEDVTDSEMREVVSMALAITKKHNPNWIIQEAVTFIILNTSAATGLYVGKWDGRHHVRITVSGKENIMDPHQRMILAITLAHELLHQRVAEIKQVDDINGLGLKEKLKHKLFTTMTPFQRAEAFSYGAAHASLLQKVINEGCAVYEELKILGSLLQDNSITAEQRQSVEEIVLLRKHDINRDNNKRESTYSKGYNIIVQLLEALPGKSVIELLNMIDWDLCGEIGYDSPQYDEILRDPRLIPGLNK